MTDRNDSRVDFDARLVDWLEGTAPLAEPDGLLGRVLSTTATTRRMPPWMGPSRPLAWLEPTGGRLSRALLVAATVALLIVASLIAVAVGTRPQVPLPLGRPGLLIAARPGELQLVNASGAITDRVATGEQAGIGAWSRDGSRLAYATGPLDRPVLVVADAALHPVLTIDVPVGIGLPVTWAPDGRRIAFWADNREVTQVFVVDVAQGAVPIAITDRDLRAERPSWSPDGDWIAFRGGVDLDQQALYIARPNGRDALRLSESGRAVDSSCGFPWTADGRTIAFATRFNGVWTVGSDGSNEHQITAASDQAYCPSLSPKGDRLAAMIWQATGKFIVVMDLAGQHRVTPAGPLYDAFPAVWSPDERTLVVNGRDLADKSAPRSFIDPDGVLPAHSVHLDGDPYLVDWQRLAP
jgi:Tol biopolymer transport system component